MPRPKKAKQTYTVIRDTREQQGWFFNPSARGQVECLGTEIKTLYPGDYTIEGYEDIFVIERKGSLGEFAQNLEQARFKKELRDMSQMEHPFLFLEFGVELIRNFPVGAGIPPAKWGDLKMTPQFLEKRVNEVMVEHPNIQMLFVGANGRRMAASLFKRLVEKYARPVSTPS